MLAKVIAKTSIYEEPRQIGEVIEVDEITFRNLSKKGRLEAVEEEPKGKGKGKPKSEE